MPFQFIKPSPTLAPFIKQYWILEDDVLPEPGCKQRIFPHGFVELTFFYGDPYLYEQRDQSSEIQARIAISGQKTDYHHVIPTGKVGILSIMFLPHGARLFFDLPINELLNQNIAFEDIIKKDYSELEDHLLHATDNEERIKLVENFLIERLSGMDMYDFNRIRECIRKINLSKGQISVEQLAIDSYLSIKQFERKFSEYVGTAPKQFLRTVRFQSAIFRRQLNPIDSLTKLSYDSGYYDQSHFSHEFKAFTGYTPRQFFKIGPAFSDYFSI